MRHWFLIALIALLPLRGGIGDAMAGKMLTQAVAATKIAAASPDSTRTGEQHADCMGHTAATSDAPAAPADCATCAHCQACSSIALALPAAIALPPVAAFARPWSADIRFASAQAARGFKPPIS